MVTVLQRHATSKKFLVRNSYLLLPAPQAPMICNHLRLLGCIFEMAETISPSRVRESSSIKKPLRPILAILSPHDQCGPLDHFAIILWFLCVMGVEKWATGEPSRLCPGEFQRPEKQMSWDYWAITAFRQLSGTEQPKGFMGNLVLSVSWIIGETEIQNSWHAHFPENL